MLYMMYMLYAEDTVDLVISLLLIHDLIVPFRLGTPRTRHAVQLVTHPRYTMPS